MRITTRDHVPNLIGNGRTEDGRRAVSVVEAGGLLGLSRSASYNAVQRGDLPTVRIGGRVLVPVAALERLLAGEADLDA